jgi:ABC-2 type transport system ATP-binding protein
MGAARAGDAQVNTAAAAPVLAVRAVSRAFGRQQVLRSVSLSVAPGEILGITGENGSGKSTLLRVMVGLLRPDAGTVERSGALGHCDQEPLVFPDLTVAEHFRYFGRAYGLPEAEWRAARDDLLDRLDFARYLDARAARLSGGTRQKLHLSLALLHRPALLVLDEPYQAFDWETYLRFWEYAAELRGRGTALLIVSHLAHERTRFDRLLELREGRFPCA